MKSHQSVNKESDLNNNLGYYNEQECSDSVITSATRMKWGKPVSFCLAV